MKHCGELSKRVCAHQPPSVQSPWGSDLFLGRCISDRMGTCILPRALPFYTEGNKRTLTSVGYQNLSPCWWPALSSQEALALTTFGCSLKIPAKSPGASHKDGQSEAIGSPVPALRFPFSCCLSSGRLHLASVLPVLLFSSRSRLFSYYCALLKRKCCCLFWSF